MQFRLLKDGDWAGIVTMAIGLSALQTLLEEGNKDDWFQSTFIVHLAVVAVGVPDRVHLDRAHGREAAGRPARS